MSEEPRGPLIPCGFCGVERPRHALRRFENELACARCRGGTYAEDNEEEVDEDEESSDELDFEEDEG